MLLSRDIKTSALSRNWLVPKVLYLLNHCEKKQSVDPKMASIVNCKLVLMNQCLVSRPSEVHDKGPLRCCTLYMYKLLRSQWALSLLVITHVLSLIYPLCVWAHSCFNWWLTGCTRSSLLIIFFIYLGIWGSETKTCLSPLSFMKRIVIQSKVAVSFLT